MSLPNLSVVLFAVSALGWASALADPLPGDPSAAATSTIPEVSRDTTIDGAPYHVRGSVLIDATRERIWALITDCDATEQIVPQLKRCEVQLEGDGWDHRRHDVRSGPFRITSVFRSDYDYLESIRISRVSGDMEVQEGSWTLTPRDNGLIELSYEAWSKPKFWVPRWFITRSIRKDAPVILSNLKHMAERPAENDERPNQVAHHAQQKLPQSLETLP